MPVGVELADDHELAALDVREQRVEHPHRAARVLAGVQRLVEAGKQPDDGVAPQLLGELLDPALELAD